MERGSDAGIYIDLYNINLLISRGYLKLHKIVADTVLHACAIIRALLLRLMLEMNLYNIHVIEASIKIVS